MEEDTGSDIAVEITVTAKELWSSETFLRKRHQEQVEYIYHLVTNRIHTMDHQRFIELRDSAWNVLMNVADRLTELGYPIKAHHWL
jgi:hypothetical protein